MDLYLLSIPLLLSLGHYFGLHRHPKLKRLISFIQSFAAGFSLAYIFLLLLPELHELQTEVHINTYVLTLTGFVIFHAALKLIFRSGDDTQKRTLMSDQLHLLTSAMYNFLIAFSLVELTRIEPRRGLILSGLVIVHTTLMELTTTKHHRNYIERFKISLAVLATAIGGSLAFVSLLSREVSVILFAIAAGGIMYVTIREELPKDSEGKPVFFVSGVLVFLLAMAFLP